MIRNYCVKYQNNTDPLCYKCDSTTAAPLLLLRCWSNAAPLLLFCCCWIFYGCLGKAAKDDTIMGLSCTGRHLFTGISTTLTESRECNTCLWRWKQTEHDSSSTTWLHLALWSGPNVCWVTKALPALHQYTTVYRLQHMFSPSSKKLLLHHYWAFCMQQTSCGGHVFNSSLL